MISYTIKPNDTIYFLAQRFDVPEAAIFAVNPGIDPYNLMIGQQILIPDTGEAAAKTGYKAVTPAAVGKAAKPAPMMPTAQAETPAQPSGTGLLKKMTETALPEVMKGIKKKLEIPEVTPVPEAPAPVELEKPEVIVTPAKPEAIITPVKPEVVITPVKPEIVITPVKPEVIVTPPKPVEITVKPYVACGISPAEMNLRQLLNKLWMENAACIRMTMVSKLSNCSDACYIEARLLRNAEDMAAALKPLYGESKADEFGRIIHKLLCAVAAYFSQIKQCGMRPGADAISQMNTCTVMAAAYLHAINPYIAEEDFSGALNSYLTMCRQMATRRLKCEYAKELATCERMMDEALGIADIMADGIVKQFPDRFK